MPTGNQGQGRRSEANDRNNAGAGQAGREAAQAAGKNLTEGVQQAGDRFREGYEAARQELAHQYRSAEGSIARNPGNSVLIGFGLGVGIGLALTAMLTHREETWADRYLPDSLRDLPDTIRNARVPEGVRSAVRDAHVPDSVHHTFHHLAEAIRDLPSTISKAVGR